MRIAQIEAIPIDVDTQVPGGIVGGMVDGIGYVLIKVYSDEGLVGYGEIGRFYEDTTQQGVVLAVQCFIAPRLVGLDPRNLARVHQELDIALRGHNYAKGAVSIALYDLVGKALGVPVYVLLGGSYRERIAISHTLGLGRSFAAVIAEAQRFIGLGHRALKVKIGSDAKQDIELVRAMREAVGPEIALRPDANQGYTIAEAIPTLRTVEQYELMLVEQPLPRWDIDGMRKVCAALDTPIMACESAYDAHDVLLLARHQAADIINLKIGRPGGLYPMMKMVAVAEAAGLPVGVGTMVEMGVGAAAHAHLAAACRDLVEPTDIQGPQRLVDDILATPLQHKDGYLHVPQGPGLGVEVDEDKVEYYRTDT